MKHALTLLLTAIAVLALGCEKQRYPLALDDAARLGKQKAPIEIVVFSDFQCSFCKKAAAELRRIHRVKGNRIKIYYKHFPLSYHPQAENAARAAESARLQGKFWEMHDQLFAYGADLTDESYAEIARKLGLDLEQFEEDISSEEVAARVEADKAEGDALGVDGTPFIFINRTVFRGSYAYLEERLNGLDGMK